MSEIAVSTKEQVGDYDAIETLKPGEPVFPVQGGDPLGPATVQFWADEYRKLALAEPDLKKRAEMLRKALAAEQVGWEMLAYQRGEEIEAGDRVVVNVTKEDELHRWRPGLIAGCRHLREAAFNLSETVPHLPEDMALALLARVDDINRIAGDYEPKRSSYGQQPELPLA